MCLWPHLVLAYPLLFILFGVLIPGFVHRHPQRNPELIKVKKGQSLLSFLFETPETSIVEDLINEEYLQASDEVASSTYSISEETSEVTVSSLMPTDSESPKKDDVAKHRKSQIALLINLRDFQNLTTDILKGINNAESFITKQVGSRTKGYPLLFLWCLTIHIWDTICWKVCAMAINIYSRRMDRGNFMPSQL